MFELIGDIIRFPPAQNEEAAVRNGAALLDATLPGWRKKIDLDLLDLNSTRCCILGQLFAHQASIAGFWYGINVYYCFDKHGRTSNDFGFHIHYGFRSRILTQCWRNALS
jgi:hypothetical protein